MRLGLGEVVKLWGSGFIGIAVVGNGEMKLWGLGYGNWR